jgi:glycerol-3-phosphate O-acyltransferase
MDTSEKTIAYSNELDHKPGFFLNWFLYKLFKRVGLDENMKESLKRMHREGTVVYAIKYRGQLDYLLYHYIFRRNRLTYPKIAFDLNMALILPLSILFKIVTSQLSYLFRHGHLPNPYQSGFYKRAIHEGTTSLIFLVDPEGFIRHFIHAEKDQLQFLLETQKEMDRPIFIVPQLVLFKKTPEKDFSSWVNIFFGFKDHLGFVRKIGLFFRHHRQAIIDFGQPLDLKAYLEDQPSQRSLYEMSAEIRQILIESIDKQKRIILGPIMKSRQQLKEIVLTDQRISGKIEDMASGNKTKRKKLRKKAGEYFDEIAADYNITYVQIFRLFIIWLSKKIFEGIDVDTVGPAKVREWARRGPMIYVPSHKSHIDYMILNYVIYEYHMHIPRIAAGQNLTFWPVGHFFRKSGAFFIRRSFRGARLYSEVFIRYIKALIEEGHPIEFYIEGGRSRNGILASPKTGFLSILLQAYQEGFCNDLIFVPTSISYDRIIEGQSYLKEIGGGIKEQENLKQFIRARRFLQRRYGKIYVRFDQPFSLREHLLQTGQSVKECDRDLAFHLIQSINSVSLVTPLSLLATAILANHRKEFSLSELSKTVNILLEFCKYHNISMAAALADPSKAIQETLSLLGDWKVVDFMEDADETEETFYYVDENKKLELEYYKNSIIHFFIQYSFVAITLLIGREEVKNSDSIISDYAFLKDLFKNEFILNEHEDCGVKVTSIIEYFLGAGFLTRSLGNGAYKTTRLGIDELPIWATLAKTFLESYWIAAKTMGQKKDQKRKSAEILKDMNYLGQRFHKLGVIDHIGALSQLSFKNAMGYINKKILSVPKNAGEDPSYPLENLSQFAKRLHELSHYGE